MYRISVTIVTISCQNRILVFQLCPITITTHCLYITNIFDNFRVVKYVECLLCMQKKFHSLEQYYDQCQIIIQYIDLIY